ncbi:MAG: PAS domain-containing protein [Planctomycetes bacterium]|nr:PAS domain-containing protein [Planctomycetota bacterium]
MTGKMHQNADNQADSQPTSRHPPGPVSCDPDQETRTSPESEPPPDCAAPTGSAQQSDRCPVVAIGASAGGFEALQKFLGVLPPDCGFALVILLHTDPTKRSYAVDLLGRDTSMTVVAAGDGMLIAPNHAYIAPAGVSLTVRQDVFHCTNGGSARGRTIDVFLRSLAEDKTNDAICIILSGTGSDGTLGIRAIKEAGGTVMAQSPDSAKYSGMPHSAIATGLVDFVLPVEALPEQLIDYLRYRTSPAGIDQQHQGDTAESHITSIFRLLCNETGHDFTNYKRNTVLRRIERRMQLRQITGYEDYVTYLRNQPEEVTSLLRDLMIGVTHFFRDPDLFDRLNELVINALVDSREGQQPIRVWVPGCATGEEAYSIAMLLTEQMSRLQKRVSVQIFATDIDEAHLDIARAGLYPESIETDVAPDRLRRFFTQEAGGYRVTKQIREMLIFSLHNLLTNPPFSRLDLISCRNVLIYLNSELQNRLLPLFHYGLTTNGFLFLGPSEHISGYSNLFAEVDRRARIFSRKTFVSQTTVDFPLFAAGRDPTRSVTLSRRQQVTLEETLSAVTERLLLSDFSPAAVLVNEQDDILRFHGRTGLYLEPPTGRPEVNVIEMARPGLRLKLRAALHQARKASKPIVIDQLHFRANGSTVSVRVTVKPVIEPGSDPGMLLIVFEALPDASAATLEPEKLGTENESDSPDVRQLEMELRSTRESLQTMVEELETSNEELKSSNEELLSMNEEMQSTNEELETSKEELQSVNEELETVNSELSAKVAELAKAHSDIKHLMESTEIATIFLDNDLRVKRYTPAVTQIFNLISTDIGRPITDLTHQIIGEHLVEDVRTVLRTLTRSDSEVRTSDGRIFIMRVLPYRSLDNVIEGAVITFLDVTAQKRGEEAIANARRLAEDIIQALRQPLLIVETSLKIRSTNQQYCMEFEAKPDQTHGRYLFEVGGGLWDDPDLRDRLDRLREDGFEFNDYEVCCTLPTAGERTILVNGRTIPGDDTRRPLLLLALTDVTEIRNTRERERLMIQELDHRVKNTLASVLSLCRLTADSTTATDDFVRIFEGRIAALSRVHEALAIQRWEGADLHDLVERMMSVYDEETGPHRITVEGEHVVLPHRVIIPITMAIHELATNAAKHGASSTSTGHITITWQCIANSGEKRLHLEWSEAGGPPTEPPTKRGVGLSLIERGIGYNLGGIVEVDFAPEGLTCRMDIPL